MAYRLTERAVVDLVDIAEYTTQQWGSAQALRYAATLEATLEKLGQNPSIAGSRTRYDLGQGVRSMMVQSHLVLYRPSQQDVEILRVLHQRMNPALHKLS